MSAAPQGGVTAIFVKRPILALVLNLLVLIAGGLAFLGVDLRELPSVELPVLSVRASYDGAAPEVVEREVTAVLEQALRRLEGVETISASSDYGSARLVLDLAAGSDVDASANDAREIIAQTLRELPDIETPTVAQNDTDADPILRLALTGAAGLPELTDLAEGLVSERLASVEGVAEVTVTGSQSRLFRVEVDMTALLTRGLGLSDIATALDALDGTAPLGALESDTGTLALRAAATAIDTESLSQTRIDARTRLGDVATVRLAVETGRGGASIDGQTSVGLDIVRRSVGNTLAISRAVRAEVAALAPALPEGVSLMVTSDDGVFIEGALREVAGSIAVATGIVIVTIYAFLGSMRATLIPAVTIPVALTGTIAAIWLAGFSVNTITLLALVLATGMVVDDAIVVVENVVRRRREGLGPRAAAILGTREVFFAVISTTATLAAVFIPISFLPGQAGGIFSEFGFVLAFAVSLSSLAALTLAPMLAGLLDPGRTAPDTEAMARPPSWAERGIDRLVGWIVRAPVLTLALCGALAILALGTARNLPVAITPDEDRGGFVVFMRAAAGQTADSLDEGVAQVETVLAPYRAAGVVDLVQSLSGRGGANTAFIIVKLAPWEERDTAQAEVMRDLSARLSGIPGLNARVIGGNSLGIRGASGSGSLDVAVASTDRAALPGAAEALLAAMFDDPAFTAPQLASDAWEPMLEVSLDHEALRDLGLDEAAVSATVNAMLEGVSAGPVFLGGEEMEIEIVPAGPAINDPGDLAGVFLRAEDGRHLPLGSVVTLDTVVAPADLLREDSAPALELQAGLGDGYRLADAVARLETLAAETLPDGTRLVLLGEAAALGETTRGFAMVFGAAFVIVLLVLAAQFESFGSAIVIMLTVPFGLAAAALAIAFTGGSLNYYSQIGLVLLVGVMAKNGILIVEFANTQRALGLEREAAIRTALRLRLRPVMMTMISTVLGALPLVLSSGAGAEARAAVGWVIIGGLGMATLFTLFLTPALYTLISRFGPRPGMRARQADDELTMAERAVAESG